MSLTGSAQGATRAEIIQKAKEWARRYYGETCIEVTLSNEETVTVNDGTYENPRHEVITGYAADWTAEVKHQMDHPSYGFSRCILCKYMP